MLINGQRALAYTARCGKISPIEGADRIDLMMVNGWCVIVKKNEFKEGDLCVFFEIDSKLPEKPWCEFMAAKHYKVKTMKLGKFNVISQGLALPISCFDVEIPNEENIDVTELLGVKYSVDEDNVRKSNKTNKDSKYASMGARHKKLFSKKPFRWLMRHEWGRILLFFFFGRNKDKSYEWPSFVKKTDEERIENMPWIWGNKNVYIATEKLDGTSCTFAVHRRPLGRHEFYVCSRNVRQKDENQKCYHDYNIYWYLAKKYNIENFLVRYMKNEGLKWVYLQGEGVGAVQGNPLKLAEDDLYCFNLVRSDTGRLSSVDGKSIVESVGLKWVPILGYCKIPDNIEEIKIIADGESSVNHDVLREGVVYRSLNGKESFKNVSRNYLLKKKE